MKTPSKSDIMLAYARTCSYITPTPLIYCSQLSVQHGCNVYLKMCNWAETGSFKEQGALNKTLSLPKSSWKRILVSASAGNHSQGVAKAARLTGRKAVIFMPLGTAIAKQNGTRRFGGDLVEIVLIGSTFDEAKQAALDYCKEVKGIFIHPYDDEQVIAGQGIVGYEIERELGYAPGMVICSIGGGGLASGLCTWFNDADCQIIGAEPLGAACMYEAIRNGKVVTLPNIDTLVAGAAVATAGSLTYEICKQRLARIELIQNEEAKQAVAWLARRQHAIVELAGALPLVALEHLSAQEKAKKTIVLVISGGNIDPEALMMYSQLAA